MRPAIVLAALALVSAARAEEFETNADAGNNSFTAVFDAKLGERITAVSSSVGCRIRYHERGGTASGECAVPLESIRVDNDDTKSDHFRQWATNRKSEPGACRLEAQFTVRLGALAPETPAQFEAEIPFRVCGRARADGKAERVSGTALLFPPGAYGDRKTIRIRATVPDFDREAYGVGPGHTEGWLARVQSLAKVVAERGVVELSLFARAKTP